MPKKTEPTEKRNVYVVSQVREQMKEAVGDDRLELRLDDGSVVHAPHPLFYSAELKAELKGLDEDDTEGMAQVLLGDDYDAWIEGGNTAEDLQLVLIQVQKDTTANLNGRRPTRS